MHKLSLLLSVLFHLLSFLSQITVNVAAAQPKHLMAITRRPEIVNTVRLDSAPLSIDLVYFVFYEDAILSESMYPGEDVDDFTEYGIGCGFANNQDSFQLR